MPNRVQAQAGPGSTVPASTNRRRAAGATPQSLANLRTFPCVKILEERGQLSLHGAFFGVMEGRLRAYDPQTNAFAAIGGEAHSAALASPRF